MCDFGQFGAFLGVFGPLLGPWGCNEFYRKNFYSAQLDIKIQLAAKFGGNLKDGYPAIVRTDEPTDGRTNRTDNYSPFPTKVGGLK